MQTSLFDNQETHFDLPRADVGYYPDFINEHQSVYQQLLQELAWRQDTLMMYGKPVPIPRMNVWYGDAGSAYSYSGLDLSPLPWTPLLLRLKNQLEEFLNTRFNSVLANHYRDGNDGVAWHSDDEPELGATPLIASLSLGATRRFSLRSRIDTTEPPLHSELAGGSLLVMAGETQRCWQHQIPKTKKPVAGRINLTYRRVQET